MATPDKDPTDVRPALRRAEAELARHLAEACDDHDRENIGQESTDELLRLEEELLAAARAADEAVRLRRRMAGAKESPATGASDRPSDAPPAEGTAARVRQFRTASGSEWRVWEVRPGTSGRLRKPDLYPADYAQGWLAFELLEGEGRKRLPTFAPDWSTRADSDLERLLAKATDVPTRKRREPDPDEGR